MKEKTIKKIAFFYAVVLTILSMSAFVTGENIFIPRQINEINDNVYSTPTPNNYDMINSHIPDDLENETYRNATFYKDGEPVIIKLYGYDGCLPVGIPLWSFVLPKPSQNQYGAIDGCNLLVIVRHGIVEHNLSGYFESDTSGCSYVTSFNWYLPIEKYEIGRNIMEFGLIPMSRWNPDFITGAGIFNSWFEDGRHIWDYNNWWDL